MWAYFIVSLWHSFTAISHTWQANSMRYFYEDPFQIILFNRGGRKCCIWARRIKWLTSECKFYIDFWDSTMALTKSAHTHRHHSLTFHAIQSREPQNKSLNEGWDSNREKSKLKAVNLGHTRTTSLDGLFDVLQAFQQSGCWTQKHLSSL